MVPQKSFNLLEQRQGFPKEKDIGTNLTSSEEPVQNFQAGYISTMSQGFKRTRKYRTNSHKYPLT